MTREDACRETGSEIEEAAWRTFSAVTRNFCGYLKAENCKSLFLRSYEMRTDSWDAKYNYRNFILGIHILTISQQYVVPFLMAYRTLSASSIHDGQAIPDPVEAQHVD